MASGPRALAGPRGHCSQPSKDQPGPAVQPALGQAATWAWAAEVAQVRLPTGLPLARIKGGQLGFKP